MITVQKDIHLLNRLTSAKKTIKRNNKYATNQIVPFLMKILEVEESQFTEDVSDSVIKLDQLARFVDNKIDSNELRSNQFESICDFKIQQSVKSCFDNFTNSSLKDRLIKETLLAVKKSISYNTIFRHNLYKIDSISFTSCTMFYLFPLLKSLNTVSKLKLTDTALFLVATYIQILDDFVDIIDDLSFRNDTPLTKRYFEIRNENISIIDFSTFSVLAKEIQKGLNLYYETIKVEISKINENIDDLFAEWDMFQIKLANIPLHNNGDFNISRYLISVKKEIPAIVCYAV